MAKKLSLRFSFKLCLHSLQYAHIGSDVTVLHRQFLNTIIFKVV